MIVLSLFDGISCGQVALEQLGIKVERYYSSEIDKYPISITQHNYPDTIQLGDIAQWREWQIDWKKINLIQGGSPCQGFSFAGKQLNFDDPRSKLFFDFVDVLNQVKRYNPKVKFMLENVRMKQEYQDIITERLGVEPVLINSSLVSAQNRQRLYWTNIAEINQPKDQGIILKDILKDDVVDPLIYQKARGKNIGGLKAYDGKTPSLTSSSWQDDNFVVTRCIQVGTAHIKGNEAIKRVYSKYGKAPTLTAMGGGHREPKVAVDEWYWRKLTPVECERLQTLPDGYTAIGDVDTKISNTQRYRAVGNGWTVEVIKHIYSNL